MHKDNKTGLKRRNRLYLKWLESADWHWAVA